MIALTYVNGCIVEKYMKEVDYNMIILMLCRWQGRPVYKWRPAIECCCVAINFSHCWWRGGQLLQNNVEMSKWRRTRFTVPIVRWRRAWMLRNNEMNWTDARQCQQYQPHFILPLSHINTSLLYLLYTKKFTMNGSHGKKARHHKSTFK